MVKRWAMRCVLVFAFPLFNILALLFAFWCALDDVAIYWKRHGITPKEFMQSWKSWDKPKEENPDAD